MTRHRHRRDWLVLARTLTVAAGIYAAAGTVLIGWRATVVAATGLVGILVITAVCMWAMVAYLERRGDVMMVDQVLDSIGTAGLDALDHDQLDALARVVDLDGHRGGGAA